MRIVIAPDTVAPTPAFFAPAVRVGNTIYVSGQLSRNAAGEVVAKGDMAGQTRQCLENLKAILVEAGSTMDHVVKITAFMTDMSLAPQAWAVRLEYFSRFPPASTGVQVSALTHPDFMIEIEAIAVIT